MPFTFDPVPAFPEQTDEGKALLAQFQTDGDEIRTQYDQLRNLQSELVLQGSKDTVQALMDKAIALGQQVHADFVAAMQALADKQAVEAAPPPVEVAPVAAPASDTPGTVIETEAPPPPADNPPAGSG